MQLYTNEFTAELKAEIDRSPFSDEQLAAMPEDARAIIAEQEAFHRQHPVTANWRIATAGSQTRMGGMVLPSIVKPQCSWTMGVTPARLSKETVWPIRMERSPRL